MMIESGMMPDTFDEQDFYRLQEVMSARSESERPEDPLEMLRRLGLSTET